MTKDLLKETISVYNKLGTQYADRIAHVKLPQLKEFAGMLSSEARVLDVGCAAGRDSAILKDMGFSVVGIDLSKNLLKLARKRVTGVDFQYMDARRLNFENEFEGIFAHAILLNLYRSEIPQVLKRFWTALKPDGICFVGVKKGSGEKFIGEALVGNMKRQETYFQKTEMENLLKDVGFKIEKSYIYGDELGRSKTKWVYIFARK